MADLDLREAERTGNRPRLLRLRYRAGICPGCGAGELGHGWEDSGSGRPEIFCCGDCTSTPPFPFCATDDCEEQRLGHCPRCPAMCSLAEA